MFAEAADQNVLVVAGQNNFEEKSSFLTSVSAAVGT